MFYSLSFFPFTLLNLGWIITNSTRSVTDNWKADTYDFIVIGGGNAYVKILVFFPLHPSSIIIFYFNWRIYQVDWQLQAVLLKIHPSRSLCLKRVAMWNIFQRYVSPGLPSHRTRHTQNNQVFIPGLIGTGESFTTLNWGYKTTPQTHLGNRQLTVGAGKALGGGTISTSNRSH